MPTLVMFYEPLSHIDIKAKQKLFQFSRFTMTNTTNPEHIYGFVLPTSFNEVKTPRSCHMDGISHISLLYS